MDVEVELVGMEVQNCVRSAGGVQFHVLCRRFPSLVVWKSSI